LLGLLGLIGFSGTYSVHQDYPNKGHVSILGNVLFLNIGFKQNAPAGA
jgi:hypothetical protein